MLKMKFMVQTVRTLHGRPLISMAVLTAGLCRERININRSLRTIQGMMYTAGEYHIGRQQDMPW